MSWGSRVCPRLIDLHVHQECRQRAAGRRFSGGRAVVLRAEALLLELPGCSSCRTPPVTVSATGRAELHPTGSGDVELRCGAASGQHSCRMLCRVVLPVIASRH